MAGQSSAMTGWSWTDVSVLGSQVFVQALMDSCDCQAGCCAGPGGCLYWDDYLVAVVARGTECWYGQVWLRWWLFSYFTRCIMLVFNSPPQVYPWSLTPLELAPSWIVSLSPESVAGCLVLLVVEPPAPEHVTLPSSNGVSMRVDQRFWWKVMS